MTRARSPCDWLWRDSRRRKADRVTLPQARRFDRDRLIRLVHGHAKGCDCQSGGSQFRPAGRRGDAERRRINHEIRMTTRGRPDHRGLLGSTAIGVTLLVSPISIGAAGSWSPGRHRRSARQDRRRIRVPPHRSRGARAAHTLAIGIPRSQQMMTSCSRLFRCSRLVRWSQLVPWSRPG